MQEVKTFKTAKLLLEEGNILVYKPKGYDPTFLILKEKYHIVAFNDNLRYPIGYNELEELLNEYTLYVYEKDNDVEINDIFKYKRQ